MEDPSLDGRSGIIRRSTKEKREEEREIKRGGRHEGWECMYGGILGQSCKSKREENASARRERLGKGIASVK